MAKILTALALVPITLAVFAAHTPKAEAYHPFCDYGYDDPYSYDRPYYRSRSYDNRYRYRLRPYDRYGYDDPYEYRSYRRSRSSYYYW